MNAAKYVLFKRGPFTSQSLEAQAFLCTKEGLDRPDIQLHFVCAGANNDLIQSNLNHETTNYTGIQYGYVSKLTTHSVCLY